MLAGLALWLLMGGVTIRPYVPPKLDPEPELTPSTVQTVQIVPPNDERDAIVLARPSVAAPLAGHVLRGSRIAVRGEVVLTGQGNGCPTRLYYALQPVGYICSTQARPTAQEPTSEPVLKLVETTPLPFRYAMVLVEEGDSLPMWGSLQELREHAEPERQLGRGDTVALAPTPQIEQFEGASYYVTVDGKVLPTRMTHRVENYSQWEGVPLTPDTHFPFAWVNAMKATVYDAPDGKKIDEVLNRTRLDILEEQVGNKKAKWARIGDGRWVKFRQLNVARKIERPANTGTHKQWFDVDLGEQVVVAYEDDQPVFATLTSSGREPNHTPRGNYPIWGKVTSITMKSQEYDDVQYYVNHVPWVMFFQAHNALHGAYWHDRFGNTKSHGCVNLAPKDAKRLFDWLQPALPNGWTSIRYWDLTEAPVAHVHDSHKAKDLIQERNIGPPDKNDEADRVSQAIARREAEAAAARAAAATPAPSVDATPNPAVPIVPVKPAPPTTGMPGASGALQMPASQLPAAAAASR